MPKLIKIKNKIQYMKNQNLNKRPGKTYLTLCLYQEKNKTKNRNP